MHGPRLCPFFQILGLSANLLDALCGPPVQSKKSIRRTPNRRNQWNYNYFMFILTSGQITGDSGGLLNRSREGSIRHDGGGSGTLFMAKLRVWDMSPIKQVRQRLLHADESLGDGKVDIRVPAYGIDRGMLVDSRMEAADPVPAPFGSLHGEKPDLHGLDPVSEVKEKDSMAGQDVVFLCFRNLDMRRGDFASHLGLRR